MKDLLSPLAADPATEDEVEGWENEGGAVLHYGDDSEPEAEGDDEEEG